MDTGTHLVIGLGLGGLAHIDPVVAGDPVVAAAVLIGTVAGSQAPDSDTLLRLRGNAVYVKNHRGLSHSLPALLLWTALITGVLALFFDGLPLLTVGLWVFIAAVFHVFTDLFNTYGTQAARPFTEKWIAWNIIHIFDPFIFTSHTAAILLWVTGMAPPEIIFPILYGLTAIYYVWRTLYFFQLKRRLPQLDPSHRSGDRYTMIPTVNLSQWQLVKQKPDGTFALGELKNQTVSWVDERIACDDHPAVQASKNHRDIAAFLYFTSFACADLKEHSWGYEVRWMDVRYRHRKQYPFVAVLLMNHDFEPLDSYIGWLSDNRLEKRLRVDLY